MTTKAVYAYAHPIAGDSRPQNKGAEVFGLFASAYARERRETMSLTDYLEGCRDDPSLHATAAERMITPVS